MTDELRRLRAIIEDPVLEKGKVILDFAGRNVFVRLSEMVPKTVGDGKEGSSEE